MSKSVHRLVDSCIICKTSKSPTGAQPVRLYPITKEPTPWHTLHIDFTGRLTGENDQKEYYSVIFDVFEVPFKVIEREEKSNHN